MDDAAAYNGGQLVAVSATFLCITWLSVVLRWFVRLHITKSIHADDWLMLIAQLIFSLMCAFLFIGVHFGIGRHDATLPQDRKVGGRKYEALATLAYILDLMFVKLSIALFLLRIAVEKKYKWILKISMVVVGLWSIGIFLYETFRCNPVEAQWDATIPHKCVTGHSFTEASYALSIMTIVSDWLYALIPIPMLWSVQMTKQAKVTVALILSLGIFASIATLVRLKYLIEISNLSDILFSGTNSITWSVMEPGLAITAASLATIRPLLRAFNITGFKSSGTTSRSASQNPNISLRTDIQSGNHNASHTSSSTGGKTHGSWGSVPGLKKSSQVRSEEISDGGSEEYILEGIGVTRTVDVSEELATERAHRVPVSIFSAQ